MNRFNLSFELNYILNNLDLMLSYGFTLLIKLVVFLLQYKCYDSRLFIAIVLLLAFLLTS